MSYVLNAESTSLMQVFLRLTTAIFNHPAPLARIMILVASQTFWNAQNASRFRSDYSTKATNTTAPTAGAPISWYISNIRLYDWRIALWLVMKKGGNHHAKVFLSRNNRKTVADCVFARRRTFPFWRAIWWLWCKYRHRHLASLHEFRSKICLGEHFQDAINIKYLNHLDKVLC